jgi:hypothetical protein
LVALIMRIVLSAARVANTRFRRGFTQHIKILEMPALINPPRRWALSTLYPFCSLQPRPR